MFRTEVNLTTGEVSQIDLTPEEVEAALAYVAQTHVFACSPWQIRKALNQAGLRAAVEAYISASSDQELKDGWEFATEFRSDDLFVLSMGAALGKTSEETQALIQLAGTL